MICFRPREWRTFKLAVAALAGTGVATSILPAPPAAAKSGREKREEATYVRPAGTPVMAVVSINQQRVTVYDADGAMLRSPISTGKPGYETPPGIFSVLEKKVEHYSNIYYDAAMPYMQRITWSGIALHAGVLPGYAASGGCIRLPIGFAERLYERTKLGMRVIVVRDDISPAEFAHPALFKPLSGEVEVTARLESAEKASTGLIDTSVAADAAPARPRQSLRSIAAAKSSDAAAAAKKAEEARRAAAKATKEASLSAKALRRAEAGRARAEMQARQAGRWADDAEGEGPEAERAQEAKSAALAALATAQAQLDALKAEVQAAQDQAGRLREEVKAAEAAKVAAMEEAKEATRKLSPVSVFISRKTQRLYVRQSREPLFDSPVSITDADGPLGTFVFTAVAYANAETELRWSVVSMYQNRNGPEPAENGKRQRAGRHTEAAVADLAGARLALDRVAIPKEAIDRISEIVSPGSTLIVSDEALSRETGKATDFIVVMSHEPQGGLKIRRRHSEAEYRYRRQFNRAPYGWNGRSYWWQ